MRACDSGFGRGLIELAREMRSSCWHRPAGAGADGSAVSDVDWESKDGRYRVRIEGEWHEVPEDAVVTEPNRVGRTMVWPIKGYLGMSIRCFMPGSMT